MSRERAKRDLPSARMHAEKLEKMIEQGNSYGAQQMYKSITVRYVSAERYAEAMDLYHSGSCLQLKFGQVTCGGELATLFVETLVKAKVTYNDESLDRIRQIYKMFPQIPVPHDLADIADDDAVQKLNEALDAARTRVNCCSSFLKAALKWSADFGAPSYGSPEIHAMLAEYMYSESPELDMAKISRHFVRADIPEKFAAALVNFTGKCYPGEDDLAIARAVLMYLSMGNLRDANCVMDEIEKQALALQVELPKSDLIQCVAFLLKTLQRDALPLFNMLRSGYKASLDRDPEFGELLDDVAEKFYGVQRRNPMQGVLGDIFKLMG